MLHPDNMCFGLISALRRYYYSVHLYICIVFQNVLSFHCLYLSTSGCSTCFHVLLLLCEIHDSTVPYLFITKTFSQHTCISMPTKEAYN